MCLSDAVHQNEGEKVRCSLAKSAHKFSFSFAGGRVLFTAVEETGGMRPGPVTKN
jgi:hypothetical protein